SILNDIFYLKTLNIKTIQTIEPIIKNALPSNYKYFIESFEQILLHEFLGAYENSFITEFYISITNIEDSKVWLQQFIDLHKVTMRETQGRTIKGICYILSKQFYCIHSHIVKSKQGTKLKIQLQKNTSCYLCVVSLNFHHNHPLKSSHVMSFHSVSDETKSVLFELFDAGHNPTDRAIIPHRNDVYYLYQKHHELCIGNQNSESMFAQLEEEMQPYVVSEKDKPGQLFVLVIVMNLMKHCYTLKEAGELVYMNMTAGLDILNTPLLILSTSTPVGGLPLAVIITSDKTADTFSKALDVLKLIIQPIEFGEHESLSGPQVIIMDDLMWRWFWDGKHNIHKNDCAILIELIKQIVFSKTKVALNQELLIWDNNTNNYAEAGISFEGYYLQS
ncbi:7646_t:CDS:2, partial [Cetraspora pellucida]